MAPSEIRLLPGASGWVQARFYVGESKSDLRRLFVRFEPDRKGRWVAVEWSIPRMAAHEYGQIPFVRVEKAVSADQRVRGKLAERFAEEAEPGFRQAYGEPVRGKPIELVRPKGHRLDDSFYARVALAYRQAVGRGLNPRQAISEAAGVSSDVAGRWIYEARKRSILPPTSPGKVGA
jgi:hypothetical protein